ncbi:C-C chemokine receptor type 6 [Echinops telfairi]|uniref:C-C chemokine receptor type 6 n=1 Tax=Echinops telfairi TaxID=9371 RepID=A0ABM0IKL7_ECHTE|nr:C-C chemokine receptor type 6 [Echinops telfairi]
MADPRFVPTTSPFMSQEALNFSSTTEYEFDLTDTDLPPMDPSTSLCSLEEVRSFSRLFVPVAYGLICIFGLLGNLLVVVTFAFYKKAKSMTDVYLLNMAVADILFVLTLPFWAANHASGQWHFSNAMCKVMKGIYAINFHCGMLLLTCVSVDRYIAIVQATRSFQLRSRTRAHSKAICWAVWLVSIVISSSTFVFNQKYRMQGLDVCEPKYHSVTDPVRWKVLVLGLQLLFGFFIPLVCMVFCYTCIIRTLVQAQNSKRHKAIRVIAAVVLVFLVCQTPHNMVLLVTAVNLGKMGRSCGHEKFISYTQTVTEVLAFLHCCLNPVLYAFIGQKFRSYFLKVMKDALCVRRKPQAPSFCSQPIPGSSGFGQTSETADSENMSSFTV